MGKIFKVVVFTAKFIYFVVKNIGFQPFKDAWVKSKS